ncbi:MAG: hypothetical protein QGG40_11215, partial [Myxococcota bacterium]|nr:hypothetical protein [Myxococcota bacterium]
MRTLFVLMALACNCGGGDDTGEVAWRPDLACPGDVGCESGDGELQAGASAVSITPTCFETWEDADGDSEYRASVDSYYDCGCDRLCDGDEGYPGPDDGEEDGEFQAVWMAGFQSGRPAMEVHDDMWARTLALRQGDTTVAIVSVDLVGYFHDDVLLSRALVEAAGTDVDHVMVTSTHQHEGPDTMGMWGRITGVTGYSEEYVSQVRAGIAQSVDEAVAALEPATLTVGAIDTSAAVPDKGTRNIVRDSRDPVVIDEMLYAALLEDAQGGTIASLVHWGNHPEVLSDENNALTSDYAHYIREAMENGVVYDSYQREGLGGTSVYVQGMVGGLMTPLGVNVTDGEGVEHSSSDWEKAEALGNVIAELAMDAIESGETVTEPDLAVRVSEIFLPVDNVAFQAMTLMGVFDRATFNYDTGESLSETNVPELRSEVDVIDLGPIRMLTVPGE